MNRKLLIVRWSVEIVVAILIVKNNRVAQLVTGIYESLHAFPSTCLFRRWQRIRVLPIVTKMRPTGDKHQHPLQALDLKFTELASALVKGREAVVLRRIFRVVTVAVRFEVAQDTDTCFRNAK